MERSLFTILVIFGLLSAGCQGTGSAEQQSTATAYAEADMQEAMDAAEESALALCGLDFEAGAEVYTEKVCALSTDLACVLLQAEIQDTWETFKQAYPQQKMACALSSSRLLEVGRQFGKNVQFWRVTLKGIQGFDDNTMDQVYWLQVAEENGKWKFSRLLDKGEIALYRTIEEMK